MQLRVSPVLTVLNVFDILLRRSNVVLKESKEENKTTTETSESESWEQTLCAVLPKRKLYPTTPRSKSRTRSQASTTGLS